MRSKPAVIRRISSFGQQPNQGSFTLCFFADYWRTGALAISAATRGLKALTIRG
jgi:hypothetical protein